MIETSNGHTLVSNTTDPNFVKSYARCTGCGQIIAAAGGGAIASFQESEAECSRRLDETYYPFEIFSPTEKAVLAVAR